MQRTLDRHRASYGAGRRMGGALPLFLLYDLAALCSLCGLWYMYMVRAHGGLGSLSSADPLVWSSLYYLKMCYGLAMLPFLVFELPLIGPALTKCRDTAYDQHGLLVGKLSKLEVATLYERKYGKDEPPDEEEMVKMA